MKWLALVTGSVFIYCLVYLFLSTFSRSRLSVNRRLKDIDGGTAENSEKIQRKKTKGRSKPGIFNISQGVKNQIALSGIKLKPEEYVSLWAFLTLVPAVIGFIMGANVFLSIALILAGTASMPLYLKTQIKKRRAMFERQLGDALLVISNGLRAGFSFPQAMENVARDLADPIKTEFKSVGREIQLGGSIESALNKVTERMMSDDMKLLTTAVVIQQQVGGNLADIIDTIAKTIRDRQSMKRSVKTLTAQGRISGKIIGFLPVALLVILTVMNPAYMQPFIYTSYGHIMIGVGVVMELIGFMVIRKLVNVKF